MGQEAKTDAINRLEKFDINSIRNIKDYFVVNTIDDQPVQQLDSKRLIQDLRKILVIIDQAEELYIYKDFDNNGGYRTVNIGEAQIAKKFKGIKIAARRYDDEQKKKFTLWDWIQAEHNKSQLRMSRIKFSPQKYDDELTYYTYHGLKYDILPSPYYKHIEHFLYHVWNVICNKNYELCDYVFNWIAKIIQEPRYKTEVILIIKGKHGTGKNTFFTNILCHLLGEYAEPNNRMDDIIGHFNSIVEWKKLLIVNEANPADDPSRKYLDNEALKTLTTDPHITISKKMEPVRTSDNVANLIIVSNNNAVNIVDGDRRLLPFTTSAEYAKSESGESAAEKLKQDLKRDAYFSRLNDEIQADDFYPTLYTYFMKRDVAKFSARNFPITKEREENIEDNRPAHEQAIIAELRDYIDGIDCQVAYDRYVAFCSSHGFKGVGNTNTFGKNVKEWLDKKRRSKGKRDWFYILNAQGMRHFQRHIHELTGGELEDEFDENVKELDINA